MPKKIVILYSGGLDSFIMKRFADITYPESDITCVYYDIGQPVAKKEMALLPEFVEIKRVDWLNSKITTVSQPGRKEGNIMIPGRNLILSSLAACQYLPDEIWMGSLYSEVHYKGTDKNYIFKNLLSGLLEYTLAPFLNDNLVIRYPFAENEMNKKDVAEWGLKNGLSKQELFATTSCHHPKLHSCGNCVQCIKRWCIFYELGIEEKYSQFPPESEYGKKFFQDVINSYNNNDNYYEEKTYLEVLKAILEYKGVA